MPRGPNAPRGVVPLSYFPLLYYGVFRLHLRCCRPCFYVTNFLVKEVRLSGKPTYEQLERRVYELERIEAEYNFVQEALAESETKYQAIFDQPIDGIFVHDLDGTIVDVNMFGRQQTEYSKDELLQLSVFDLQSEASQVNLPRDRIIEAWKKLSPMQRIYIEAEHQHKDGS